MIWTKGQQPYTQIQIKPKHFYKDAFNKVSSNLIPIKNQYAIYTEQK